jgi:hypothetical protein
MTLRPISTATSLIALAVALKLSLAVQPAVAQTTPANVKVNPERDAYYGDLHLHTTYSFDAYVLFGAKVDPDMAYRFAKGEPVEYLGQMVQRREPLDFLAVTDHSENIGVFNKALPTDSPYADLDFVKGFKEQLASVVNPDGTADPQKALPILNKYFIDRKEPLPQALQAESKSAWGREIAFANKNNEPGKFTAFIAYEWTSMIDGANLHRNVIFKGDSAPLPFTSLDSKRPEDLWNYLQTVRKQGYEALAIPHNGNASNGLMYDWTTVEGKPIDKVYAQMRQENEPLSEIGQNKGNSETHPILSPNDEFANFEIFDQLLISPTYSKPQGSYVRDALSRGLVMQRTLGVNPYKDGIVGASDLHGGLSVSAQADYGGYIGGANIGAGKVTKQQASATLGVTGDDGHSAGFKMLKTTSGYLTGAWAESNTRDSIYNAFRRKETFATSGTRLKFRFFGGWNLDKGLLDQPDWVKAAYAAGVPMGGDLPASSDGAKAPSFAVWAVKDPNSGNLDRVQIVKVWEDGGQQQQKVFDVAWSDNRKPDPATGKLPDVGNTVDLTTGKYTNTIGATELKAVWTDPEFKPDHLAAYYLRVLEIPTPRWSTLLALQTGLPIPKDAAATIQERGYSSPIWYTPKSL